MHPILFEIGGFTIYSYGLAVAVAALLCFKLSGAWAGRFGVNPENAVDGVFVLFIAGIAGARLFYVGQHLTDYAAAPWRVLWLREGGLVWYGGFIGAAVTGVIYAAIRRWPFLKMADLYAPILALAHGIGRIGCFLNGCCYGRSVKHFGVVFHGDDVARIPAQLIEAAGLFLLASFLLARASKDRKEGECFALYLILYGLLRFSVEFLRGDQDPIGIFTIAQWISIGMMLIGLFLRNRLKVRS